MRPSPCGEPAAGESSRRRPDQARGATPYPALLPYIDTDAATLSGLAGSLGRGSILPPPVILLQDFLVRF